MIQKPASRHGTLNYFAEYLHTYFPDLKQKLVLAGMPDAPVSFIEKILVNAIFLSIALLLLSAIFIYQNAMNMLFLIPLALLYLFIVFHYLMYYPDAVLLKRKRELDYEILFAGRHLLIALRSGLPLFDSLAGLTTGYGEVSKEFNHIVEKVGLGVPMSQAIREVAQNSPSQYFVRIITQISNSLSSGADLANSVEIATDQIAKEQMIQLKEYGQKLTPLVMFFMVIGIILPSIGVAIFTVMSVFLGGSQFGITSFVLILVLLGIIFVQFLFLGLIETSRPKYLIR